MNLYLKGLLALLTDERHPETFRAVDAVNGSFSSALGPRATFDQVLPNRMTATLCHGRALSSPLVWLLSRNVT